jgi:membrane protease YdiL (CAAX protease family)
MNPTLNRRRENPWPYLIVPVVILNLVTICTLAVYSAFGAKPYATNASTGTQPLFWVYLASALTMWGFALFAIIKLKREGSSISKLIAPGGNPLKVKWHSTLVVFLTICLIYAAQISLSVIIMGQWSPHSALPDWQRLVLATLIPISFGYTEELFWRGFIITRLKAYGVSSLGLVLFSAFAYSLTRGIIIPGGIVYALLLGIVTGVYYLRERNLIPLMFAHALADALSFGLLFLVM